MPEIVTMTMHEWKAEAVRRFGKDPGKWKFICPVCGNVQSPEDFEPYKDQGAQPDSCTHVCLGRYTNGRDAFKGGAKGQPCNYTAYGLIQLSPIRVTDPDSETPIHCFAFAEAEE